MELMQAPNGTGPRPLRRDAGLCYRSSMATAIGRTPHVPAPNQSAFTELYAFERPRLALSPEAFVEELKDLARATPIDAELASALKYGTAPREHCLLYTSPSP